MDYVIQVVVSIVKRHCDVSHIYFLGMASVSGDGVSLEQAIRSKYCNDWIEYPTGFKETCLYYRPGKVAIDHAAIMLK